MKIAPVLFALVALALAGCGTTRGYVPAYAATPTVQTATPATATTVCPIPSQLSLVNGQWACVYPPQATPYTIPYGYGAWGAPAVGYGGYSSFSLIYVPRPKVHVHQHVHPAPTQSAPQNPLSRGNPARRLGY
jgi:hypothetical protein